MALTEFFREYVTQWTPAQRAGIRADMTRNLAQISDVMPDEAAVLREKIAYIDEVASHA